MFKKSLICAILIMVVASFACAAAFQGWMNETQLIPPTEEELGDVVPSWVYGSQGYYVWDGLNYDTEHMFMNAIEKSDLTPPVFGVPFNEPAPHVGGRWYNTNVPVVVDINGDGQDEIIYCHSYERSYENTSPGTNCPYTGHAWSNHICTHYTTKVYVYTFDSGLNTYVLMCEYELRGVGNASIAAFKHAPVGQNVIVLNGQREFFENVPDKSEVTALLYYNGMNLDIYAHNVYDFDSMGGRLRMFDEGNEIFVSRPDRFRDDEFLIAVMGKRNLRFMKVEDTIINTVSEMEAASFFPWAVDDATFDAKAGLIVDFDGEIGSRFYTIVDEMRPSEIVSFVLGAEIPSATPLPWADPIKYHRVGTHFDPMSQHSDDRIHVLVQPERGMWLSVTGNERVSEESFVFVCDKECTTTEIVDAAQLQVDPGEYFGVPLMLVDYNGERRFLSVRTALSGEYFLHDYNLESGNVIITPKFGTIERSYHQGNIHYFNPGRSLRLVMRKMLIENGDIAKYDNVEDSYPNDFVIGRFYGTNEYRENKFRTGSLRVYISYNWATYASDGSGEPIVSEMPATPALDTEVFPNPYNAMTSVKVTISDPTDIRVAVYNLMGQEVYRANKLQAAQGLHKFAVNSVDWSNGIYFLKVEANRQTQMKKLVLVK